MLVSMHKVTMDIFVHRLTTIQVLVLVPCLRSRLELCQDHLLGMSWEVKTLYTYNETVSVLSTIDFVHVSSYRCLT